MEHECWNLGMAYSGQKIAGRCYNMLMHLDALSVHTCNHSPVLRYLAVFKLPDDTHWDLNPLVLPTVR